MIANGCTEPEPELLVRLDELVSICPMRLSSVPWSNDVTPGLCSGSGAASGAAYRPLFEDEPGTERDPEDELDEEPREDELDEEDREGV